MSNSWIRYLTPWIAPIFVIIWSTGFIIARYGMPHAEPMTFLSMRFLGVLICMIPIVLLWKAPWPRQSQIIHIAIAMAGGYGINIETTVEVHAQTVQLALQLFKQLKAKK